MIAFGDISNWSKGAVGFRYPEPKNRNRPTEAVTFDLQRTSKPVDAKVYPQVMVASNAKETAKKEITGDDTLKTVEFSNLSARVLSSLVKRNF